MKFLKRNKKDGIFPLFPIWSAQNSHFSHFPTYSPRSEVNFSRKFSLHKITCDRYYAYFWISTKISTEFWKKIHLIYLTNLHKNFICLQGYVFYYFLKFFIQIDKAILHSEFIAVQPQRNGLPIICILLNEFGSDLEVKGDRITCLPFPPFNVFSRNGFHRDNIVNALLSCFLETGTKKNKKLYFSIHTKFNAKIFPYNIAKQPFEGSNKHSIRFSKIF